MLATKSGRCRPKSVTMAEADEYLSKMHPKIQARNVDILRADAERGKGGGAVRTYMLPLRPRSLKNSRVSRGNYSAVNPGAKARLEHARQLLSIQHGPELLQGCYDVEICFYRSDNKNLLDTDAIATFCFEALQKTVVPNDSPRHLRDVIARPRLSRYRRDVIEIILTEVVI